MADPPWKEVLKQIAVPHIRFDKSYFLLFITMVGTTITPYMQFYLQSAVVDKGVRIEEYRYARYDVYLGSFMTIFIAFFIVLATGTILHPAGVVVGRAEIPQWLPSLPRTWLLVLCAERCELGVRAIEPVPRRDANQAGLRLEPLSTR